MLTTSMTSEARRELAKTIRALRARLLEDLHGATEAAYRLSVRAQDAGLAEDARARRARLEAWVAEQARAQGPGGDKAKGARSGADFRREAEAQAAYTLLNRLVLLRLLEAPRPGGPLRAPAVLTGGWESRGYKDLRQLAPALARDETEGYAFLLRLVFEDLAAELPGLYGPAGVAELVPVPAATLRHVVDALDAPALQSAWTDELTLGWVYQYWNDPEREDLDAKLAGGGKLANHEIASKTQMFTERYMVDWLLQNSLGPLWLAVCRRNGWTADAERAGEGSPCLLHRLDERRAAWRAQRAAGQVALTELMPLEGDEERRWAYTVPQPIPDDAVDKAPATLRGLKLLDPAVGSGHFLVVALELLLALFKEEARHRGEAGEERWTDRAIVEHLLGEVLHGVDLDPRAVQIAAAALWLRARTLAPDARAPRLNLVAANLRLASLPDDDPALGELRREVERETGIPAALTDEVVHALRGADHLGSLLKIDRAVDEALDRHEAALGRVKPEQGDLFGGFSATVERVPIGREEAKATLLGRLEGFLAKHTGGDDLGLRLRGEQLAAGVRFVRMLREGRYDLVVANPPYLGAGKLAESASYKSLYPIGSTNFFAGFMLRALELVREQGIVAVVTLTDWMFLKLYSDLRAALLSREVVALADFGKAAFSTGGTLISSSCSVIRRSNNTEGMARALRTFEDYEPRRDEVQPYRTSAALLAQVGRYEFDPAALKVVPEWPVVYWWDEAMLAAYRSAPLIMDASPSRAAQSTGDNSRFVRFVWETPAAADSSAQFGAPWAPFVNGAEGREWLEPSREVVNWAANGIPIKSSKCHKTGVVTCSLASEEYFLRSRGISFSMIGANFAARVHRFPSIFGNKGSSVFPDDLAGAVCAMNSTRARDILQSLNPGIGFEVGDVNRLPLFPIADSATIFAQVESAFTLHESHREPSVEFRHPGPSPWRHAQEWAQSAVDRPDGAPLPDYTETLDPEQPTDHLSYALGVSLGRFSPSGAGVLDPATADLSRALPHGILFLDRTLDDADRRDGLGHPAAAPLHAAWAAHASALDTKRGSLRDYLALDFFATVHKPMYESRPIHWPLSSASRTFVAWVTIHRMTEGTLTVLLADHLMPALARLDGELADMRAAKDGADPKAAKAAEKRYDRVLKGRDELAAFAAAVEQCADRGAPPPDAACTPREQDARYAPDLDDGVMINSAALWPLLDPQWKDPKKWWKELATAEGRKDYDWSHLALRVWPTRVDAKCQRDPSLGVAHGCFWRYHPERAWAWELRLQDELSPDHRIEEPPYRPGGRDLSDPGSAAHRAAFLRDRPAEALAAVEKEATRRMGRGKARRPIPELPLLEPGLWSAHPAALWELELDLAQKQGADLRITAPDEPAARAAWLTDNPGAAAHRAALLAQLTPPDLFDEDDGAEDEADPSEDDTEEDA